MIGSQEPSPLISQALNIYSQNQCKMFFCFYFAPLTLFLNFKLAFKLLQIL